jgi:hypothetical protein
LRGRRVRWSGTKNNSGTGRSWDIFTELPHRCVESQLSRTNWRSNAFNMTLYTRVLLEKLIVPHLVKNVPDFIEPKCLLPSSQGINKSNYPIQTPSISHPYTWQYFCKSMRFNINVF